MRSVILALPTPAIVALYRALSYANIAPRLRIRLLCEIARRRAHLEKFEVRKACRDLNAWPGMGGNA